jgi:hypothetical protein
VMCLVRGKTIVVGEDSRYYGICMSLQPLPLQVEGT